jgi:hypothetical protein
MQLARYRYPTIDEITDLMQLRAKDYLKGNLGSFSVKNLRQILFKFLLHQSSDFKDPRGGDEFYYFQPLRSIDSCFFYLSTREFHDNFLERLSRGDKETIELIKKYREPPTKGHPGEEFLEVRTTILAESDILDYQRIRTKRLKPLQKQGFYYARRTTRLHPFPKTRWNFCIRLENDSLYDQSYVEGFIRERKFTKYKLEVSDNTRERPSYAFRINEDPVSRDEGFSRRELLNRVRLIYSSLDSPKKLRKVPDFSEDAQIQGTYMAVYNVKEYFQNEDIMRVFEPFKSMFGLD